MVENDVAGLGETGLERLLGVIFGYGEVDSCGFDRFFFKKYFLKA